MKKSPELDIAHAVVDGCEVAVPLEPDQTRPPIRSGRFANALKPESLARIARVVEMARALECPTGSRELIQRAEAGPDEKGALGALRMLDSCGVVHAISGGRRSLIWCPGPRPQGASPPRLAHHSRYLHLGAVMQACNDRWHSTDWLVVEAGFDLDLYKPSSLELPETRGYRGLPLNFFRDSGKSARKYVLGALKALYWLELVAWRLRTRQAVEWCWIGHVEGRIRIPATPAQSVGHDPYLVEERIVDRATRIAEQAAHRAAAFHDARQRWIDAHYPEAAEAYRITRERRSNERPAASGAEKDASTLQTGHQFIL